jgi:hypothetical protein
MKFLLPGNRIVDELEYLELFHIFDMIYYCKNRNGAQLCTRPLEERL